MSAYQTVLKQLSKYKKTGRDSRATAKSFYFLPNLGPQKKGNKVTKVCVTHPRAARWSLPEPATCLLPMIPKHSQLRVWDRKSCPAPLASRHSLWPHHGYPILLEDAFSRFKVDSITRKNRSLISRYPHTLWNCDLHGPHSLRHWLVTPSKANLLASCVCGYCTPHKCPAWKWAIQLTGCESVPYRVKNIQDGWKSETVNADCGKHAFPRLRS